MPTNSSASGPGNRPPFLLCLVTDQGRLKGADLTSVCKKAAGAGLDAVMLREKDLSGKALYELGCRLSEALEKRAALLINDRADVAAAIQKAGVHLPASGLSIKDARKVLGPGRLIGKSTHSLEEARAAEQAGADYIIFGPVYETESKKAYGAPQGIERLREVASTIKVPVCAIGGITPERVQQIKQAGASSMAVMSYILDSEDPARATRELIQAWQTNRA